jgi:REP element-mobilizing transposase RayT
MVRLESPGAIVHVMARGIDGKNIFTDDEDRREFLSRLTTSMANCGYKCFAWTLMDNHYHLLLRTNEKPISNLMRPLNGSYARWFNKKYLRRGYLFQDRYKSVLCQDQEYARQLIRYIHLNPMRAKKVHSLGQLKHWRWCGHGFLLDVKGAQGILFQDRIETLRRFGTTEKKGLRAYIAFLEECIHGKLIDTAGVLSQTESYELIGSQKGWPAVIGDPAFVRHAMSRHEIGQHRKHRQADYPLALREIAVKVCSIYSIKPNELLTRGRQSVRSDARASFCYLTHEEELLPMAVIARFLHITIPSVATLFRRGKSLHTPQA